MHNHTGVKVIIPNLNLRPTSTLPKRQELNPQHRRILVDPAI
jgi:hypothetical protein